MSNIIDLQPYALYHHIGHRLFLAAKRRSSQERETTEVEGFIVVQNAAGYWVPKDNNTNLVKFNSDELDYQLVIIEPYPVVIT